MSIRDWQLRIEDILEAIRRIKQYTDGFDYDLWLKDQKTIDAVIRNFEIIGEAATHVPSEIQARNPALPWAKMKGIRNLLIHEYFGVDAEVLWRTIQEDLPGLEESLSDLLEKTC